MGMLKSMWGMITARIRGVSMIPCEEALDSLFEFLDGEIDEERAAAIETHLEICRRCYPRAQFERAFLAALGGIKVDQSAPSDLRERVLAGLEAEGY